MRINKSDLLYAANHFSDYTSFSKNTIDVWYFSRYKNVGDLVGPYLLMHLTGKNVRKNIFGITNHFLTVGSIMDQVTANSHIWGSGFIASSQNICCKPKSIQLVRGHHSRAKLEKSLDYGPIEVGDPALMLPLLYNPTVKKKYPIGLVLHYSEKGLLKELSLTDSVKVIDVQQDVEPFINELLECETIISSSLHGLIFADAYGIPNRWLKMTNNLDGDDFKFADYYSVLYKNELVEPISLSCIEDLNEINKFKSKCFTVDSYSLALNIKNSFCEYD